jgi:hypothetical protein
MNIKLLIGIIVLAILGYVSWNMLSDKSTVPETVTTTASYDVPEVNFLESYVLTDEEFGTKVTVTMVDGVRTMVSNALPNHEVGEFPNEGNPNTISEQEITNVFPLDPMYTGAGGFARQAGVALNGVKFEPQTAERLTCATGEVYSVEALEGYMDFGVDFNNAHVQPTGEYHYHGVAENLVSAFAEGDDPVLVGFAQDGFLIYSSPSNAYQPSYALKTEPRTGTDCTYVRPGLSIDEDLEGTFPDGSFVSDWEYVAGKGNLDECNGAEINGQYAYVLTDEYPYVPRCLNGEMTGEQGGDNQAGGPPVNGGERPARPPQQ